MEQLTWKHYVFSWFIGFLACSMYDVISMEVHGGLQELFIELLLAGIGYSLGIGICIHHENHKGGK